MSDATRLEDAYAEWLQAQRTALDIILGAGRSLERERVEGMRYVSRLTALALALYVENNDPLHPRLERNLDEHSKKFACDNPDTLYWRAPIRAGETYRLWGCLGNSPYTAIALEVDLFSESDLPKGTVAQYLAEEYRTGDDQRFEVTLSRDPQPGNWIEIPEGVTNLLVRQTFLHEADRASGALHLERLSGDRGSRRPLSPDQLIDGLKAASRFLVGCITMFKAMADAWAHNNTNGFGYSGASADGKSRSGADPHVNYFQGYWRLAPDEALVIAFEEPEQFRLWSFMLANYWSESLDYAAQPRIATNSERVRPDSDGKIVLVIAHEDPGMPGWVSTDGCSEGLMLLRWVLADSPLKPPAVTLCKLSALK